MLKVPAVILHRKDRLIAILALFVPVGLLFSPSLSLSGIQFPFFAVSASGGGISWVVILQDLGFVTIRILLWAFGLAVLVAGLVLSFLEEEDISSSYKRTGILLCTAAVLFLASYINQLSTGYGSGGGYAVPIGVFLLCMGGYWIFRLPAKSRTGT